MQRLSIHVIFHDFRLQPGKDTGNLLRTATLSPSSSSNVFYPNTYCWLHLLPRILRLSVKLGRPVVYRVERNENARDDARGHLWHPYQLGFQSSSCRCAKHNALPKNCRYRCQATSSSLGRYLNAAHYTQFSDIELLPRWLSY
jgi:hypothetical protein